MPTEFVRRFLLHVLPSGIKRIRHSGVLASACKGSKLNAARQALQMPALNPKALESAQAFMTRVARLDVGLCPVCKMGHLRTAEVLAGARRLPVAGSMVLPQERGPPRMTQGGLHAGGDAGGYISAHRVNKTRRRFQKLDAPTFSRGLLRWCRGLPPTKSILFAEHTTLHEPELFYMGWFNPQASTASQPKEHANGLLRLLDASVGIPAGTPLSASSLAVQSAGLLRFHTATQYELTLSFKSTQSVTFDLRPTLPLIISGSDNAA